MENPLNPEVPIDKNYLTNQEIEEGIRDLPDAQADALFEWRQKTTMRKKIGSKLKLKYRNTPDADGKKRSVAEAEWMCDADDVYYKACIDEGLAESEFNRKYEKLLSLKALRNRREF